MGRPLKNVLLDEKDWKNLDSLCVLFCTLTEIAGFFDVSEDTIEARVKGKHGITFSEYFQQKSATGAIALRRSQFRLAQTNAPMAMYLGVQYLGQVNEYRMKHSIDGKGADMNGLRADQLDRIAKGESVKSVREEQRN
jgi:hypothetical protein